MMALEGPFLAAIIARMPAPKANLAAYGVAYSLALFMEAPVIMLMSAATALVKDWPSYLKMRRFTFLLIGGVTTLMLILLTPPLFKIAAIDLIGLPDDVAALTHRALLVLLPWPGAIGYRRLYQGILIRSHSTRRVAYGTVIRLSSISATALLLYIYGQLEGVIVGAAALSGGVVTEAIASRRMAAAGIRRLRAEHGAGAPLATPLTLPGIAKFYYPLALTSIIGLGVHPLVTFFMGQSRLPLESLAVLPVVNAFVFIFRSIGLSYQEVGIALLGDYFSGFVPLRRMALKIMAGASGTLALLAFTPLANVWYETVSGLSPNLAALAITATQILVLMPVLSVLLSFQRSVMVNVKKTTPITVATALEIAGIFGMLMIGVHWLQLIGVVAAASAYLVGRMCANLYLYHWNRRVMQAWSLPRLQFPRAGAGAPAK